MIGRDIAPFLERMATEYPVVTMTGPRQSGKTTLIREMFRGKDYYNLEQTSTLDFALRDPEGFINQMPEGAIIDEIQRAPQLLSLIQVAVDENPRKGRFILTGSAQLQLLDAVSQSLAGRTALVTLLPLSLHELREQAPLTDAPSLVYTGFMPRIYNDRLVPTEALDYYFRTYVERDVRLMSQIHNLDQFQTFVRMCAGRVGQILNLSALGSDVGISQTTARAWLSILQASYILFTLEPHHLNINRRLVKSPKLYFYDVGLAAFLLGIERAGQVQSHPLYGNLFENMVVVEFLKYRFNRGRTNNLSFYRDAKGNEIDLLYADAQHLLPVEIKAGMTVHSEFFKGLDAFRRIRPESPHGRMLVYGGDTVQRRSDTIVLPPAAIHDELSALFG